MTGTIDSINEALDGLQFKPEDNFDGIANLWIITDDLGNCGIGGTYDRDRHCQDRRDRGQRSAGQSRPGRSECLHAVRADVLDATGNAIRITDPDAGDSPVQVTLSVDQGTLSLNRRRTSTG